VQRIFQELETSSDEDSFRIDYHRIVRSESFTQIFLFKEKNTLKLDLVNDTAPHFGDFENKGRSNSLFEE